MKKYTLAALLMLMLAGCGGEAATLSPIPAATNSPLAASNLPTSTSNPPPAATNTPSAVLSPTLTLRPTRTAVPTRTQRATVTRSVTPTRTPTWDTRTPQDTPTRRPSKTPTLTHTPGPTHVPTPCLNPDDKYAWDNMGSITRNLRSAWLKIDNQTQGFNYPPESEASVADAQVTILRQVGIGRKQGWARMKFVVIKPVWLDLLDQWFAIGKSDVSAWATWSAYHDKAMADWAIIAAKRDELALQCP